MSNASSDDRRVKLITVHGTGGGRTKDDDPLANPEPLVKKWWEPGSDFLEQLFDRLGLEEADVEIEPFEWFMDENGPNSEAKRRESGRHLYHLLAETNDQGRDFYLIGHSHGGSVIYSALLRAVRRKKMLDHLKGWCTVGTPYLDYRPNRFLFQRLGNFALSAYTAGRIALILLVFFIGLIALIAITDGISSGDGAEMILVLLSLGFFAIPCIAIIFFLERRRDSRFVGHHKQKLYETYGGRWIGLWHRDDEAISALYNIRNVTAPIVPPTFLDPIISTAQFTLMILLVIVAFGGLFLENEFVSDQWEQHLMAPIGQVADREIPDQVFVILNISFKFCAFFLVFWAGAWFLRKFALLIGRPVSRMLNKIIWTSVREGAWGDDIIPERVRSITPHPPEFDEWYDPLPEPIDSELAIYSNKAAFKTLEKVRAVLGMSAADEQTKADIKAALADTLEWDELIHTAYFEVPAFIDTIAMGFAKVGMVDDVKTVALGPDDRARLDAWYAVQPNPEPIPARRVKNWIAADKMMSDAGTN